MTTANIEEDEPVYRDIVDYTNHYENCDTDSIAVEEIPLKTMM